MTIYFQNPENSLKRANEFIDVGKKHRAMTILLDLIKSRKYRTWQKILEPIMIKYLELCVDLRKSHMAKEGLFHYRNICHQVCIKSFEDVTRGYLQLSEEKVEAVKEKSEIPFHNIEDLDNVHTPESILMNAVIAEDSENRFEDTIITLWMRFLWESYKYCLEILRNNVRVEKLYNFIAQKALCFCVLNNRKTEFRKLSESMRTHFGHTVKQQYQGVSINLNIPESQDMYIETRLIQLDYAILMELWQEAFKAIEDIYSLRFLSNKPFKVTLMATYYQKLSLVFWKSGNSLYHAAALYKFYQISKDLKKNITSEEIQILSSRVILATLAIPYTSEFSQLDFVLEANERLYEKNKCVLASLLNLQKPPSRFELMKDIVKYNIFRFSHPLVFDIYNLIELNTNPQNLSNTILTCLQSLSVIIPELNQYGAAIKENIILRILTLLSGMYESISFEKLASYIPFANFKYIELVIVNAIERGIFYVNIDHQNRGLQFGLESKLMQKQLRNKGFAEQSLLNPKSQPNVIKLFSSLEKCVSLINNNFFIGIQEEIKSNHVLNFNLNTQNYHCVMLERQKIIEKRKEVLETMTYLKVKEERQDVELKQREIKDFEMSRMAREAEIRTKQRLVIEQNEIKKKVIFEKLELLKKTEMGAKLLIKLDPQELENIDPEEILVKEMEKERSEYFAKLRKQEKYFDYVERAKRLEELELLKKEYEVYKIEAKLLYVKVERDHREQIKDEYNQALRNIIRISRTKEDQCVMVNKAIAAYNLKYKKEFDEYYRKIYEKNEAIINVRRQKRKEERKIEWLKVREEKKKELLEIKEKTEKQKKIEERKKSEQTLKSIILDIEIEKEKYKNENKYSIWKHGSMPGNNQKKNLFQQQQEIDSSRSIFDSKDWKHSDTQDWRCGFKTQEGIAIGRQKMTDSNPNMITEQRAFSRPQFQSAEQLRRSGKSSEVFERFTSSDKRGDSVGVIGDSRHKHGFERETYKSFERNNSIRRSNNRDHSPYFKNQLTENKYKTNDDSKIFKPSSLHGMKQGNPGEDFSYSNRDNEPSRDFSRFNISSSYVTEEKTNHFGIRSFENVDGSEKRPLFKEKEKREPRGSVWGFGNSGDGSFIRKGSVERRMGPSVDTDEFNWRDRKPFERNA